jgi:hypothetical protein
VIRATVAHHIFRFAESAHAEVGFDVGLKPQTLEISPADGIVVAFATMKASAAKRLVRLSDVREQLDRITALREPHPDRVVGRPVEECDFILLMDLLVCSLPKTFGQNSGMDLPSLIDRTVDAGLRQYESVAALREPASDLEHLWPIRNDEWLRNPSRSRH